MSINAVPFLKVYLYIIYIKINQIYSTLKIETCCFFIISLFDLKVFKSESVKSVSSYTT